MDALMILRNIIEDGYLSDTNMQRGRALLDSMNPKYQAHSDLAELCRLEYSRGDKVSAVRRFRQATGCSVTDAVIATRSA